MTDENTNPFQTQTSQPAAPPTDYGAMGKSIADGMKGSGFFGKDGFSVEQASTPTRTVDAATGTVSGQLDSILAKDGVHMQRARANALSMAADRGLINSSMAIENAQGAMIDRATPIATADANIYDGASRDNQNAALQTNLANTAAKNNFGGLIASQMGEFARQDSAQKFQSGQSSLDREQQILVQSLQEKGMDRRQAETIAAQMAQQKESQSFQSNQQKDAQSFQSTQQKDSQAFQSGENKLSRDQQSEMFSKQVEADNARILQQHELTLKQMGYSSELATKSLPQQYAADLAKTTLNSINSIAADPNLTPEAKKGAIQNVIDAANASAALGEKLYGVTLPRQSMPGASSGIQTVASPKLVNNDFNGVPVYAGGDYQGGA